MNKKEIISLLSKKNIPKEYLYYLINYYFLKYDLWEYFCYYKIIIKDIWCNAKCPICEDWKRKWNTNKIRINLYKALKEILKENAQKKQIQILWWEPILIFEDLLKIIKICKKYKIKIDFPTNASLLNIEKIDKLVNAWLDNFTFSIDFPDIFHDKWRNLEWAFEKIIYFTNYLKQKNIKVQWNTVVWKFNYKNIKDFEKLYIESSPDVHNFIWIENHWWSSLDNLISLEEKNNILKNLKEFEIKQNIKINKNWFQEYNNIFWKCYLVLKNKVFFVSENNIEYWLCHYEKPIDKIKRFKNEALNLWCDKCSSSYKEVFNINFSSFLEHTS